MAKRPLPAIADPSAKKKRRVEAATSPYEPMLAGAVAARHQLNHRTNSMTSIVSTHQAVKKRIANLESQRRDRRNVDLVMEADRELSSAYDDRRTLEISYKVSSIEALDEATNLNKAFETLLLHMLGVVGFPDVLCGIVSSYAQESAVEEHYKTTFESTGAMYPHPPLSVLLSSK